ncbi:MAG: IS66 family transposase [Spirochaetia bacterium]
MRRRGPRCWGAGRATCRRHGPASIRPSDWSRTGRAIFRFLTTPGIEPTNNLAEQAIRFVVIDRRITQGTRSQRGDRWCERIWTVMATCGQQGRSVFAYLESAVTAWFHGAESPTLLPSE